VVVYTLMVESYTPRVGIHWWWKLIYNHSRNMQDIAGGKQIKHITLKLPSHGTQFCMRCSCGGVRISIGPLRKSITYIVRRPQKHRSLFEHVQKIRARQNHALATEQGHYRSDSSKKALFSVRIKFCLFLLRSRL
jgi:hypothetical protein